MNRVCPPVGAPGQLRHPKGGFIEPETESPKRNSPAASVQPFAYAILLRRYSFGGQIDRFGVIVGERVVVAGLDNPLPRFRRCLIQEADTKLLNDLPGNFEEVTAAYDALYAAVN